MGTDHEIETYLKIYEVWRKRVEHEDKWINDRLSWFIWIQAALLAFYYTIFVDIIKSASETPRQGLIWELVSFGVLAAISVAICCFVCKSVDAAQKEIKRCEERYVRYRTTQPSLSSRSELPASLIASEGRHQDGHTLAHYIPFFWSGLWGIAAILIALDLLLHLPSKH